MSVRESLKLLPRRKPLEWKQAAPKGGISQDAYESSRGKQRSWKPK